MKPNRKERDTMKSQSQVAIAAKQIRAALKTEMGLISRDVSVRSSIFSMGSSIDVTIKRLDVSIAKVEEIANRAKIIHRDQFGDILGGGNRYVSVDYAHGAISGVVAPLAKHLDALMRGDVKAIRWRGFRVELESACDRWGDWRVTDPSGGRKVLPGFEAVTAARMIVLTAARAQ